MSCQAFVPATSLSTKLERGRITSSFQPRRLSRKHFPAAPSIFSSASLGSDQRNQKNDGRARKRDQLRPKHDECYLSELPSTVSTRGPSSALSSPASMSLASVETEMNNALEKRQNTRIPHLFKYLLICCSRQYSSDLDGESENRNYGQLLLQYFRSCVTLCLSVRDSTSVATLLNHSLHEASPILPYLQLSYLIPSLMCLASQGRFRILYSILTRLFESSKQHPKVKPDLRCIIRISSAAIDLKSYKYSLKFMNLLSTHYIHLNSHAYSVLLKCHGRSNNLAAVTRIINTVTNSNNNIILDNVLFNCALDALIRCNDTRNAHQLLLNVSYGHLLDEMSYNTVIKGFVREGKVRHGFRLVNRMQSFNLQIDAITINTLISGCVKVSDFKTAKSMIDIFYMGKTSNNSKLIQLKPPSPKRPPTTPPELRQSLLAIPNEQFFNSTPSTDDSTPLEYQSKDFQDEREGESEDDFESDDDNFNVEPLIVLGVSSAATSSLGSLPWKESLIELDSDKDLFNKMNVVSKNESKFKNQLRIAMTTLICGLAEKGLVSEALSTFNELSEYNIKPNTITYASLISACFNQGHAAEAMTLFDSMDDETDRKTFAPSKKDPIVMSAVISGLSKQDEYHWVETATNIMETILSTSHQDVQTPNKRLKSSLYTKSSSTGEEGNETNPMEASNSQPVHISEQRYINDSNNKASNRYPNKQFKGQVLDVEAVNSIINGYVRLGKFERAEFILKLMKKHRIKPTAASYTTLIRGYTEMRQFQRAKRIFNDMIRVRKVEPDRVAMNAFISACSRSGDMETANQVLEYMEKNHAVDGDNSGDANTVNCTDLLNPSAQSYSPILLKHARAFDNVNVWKVYDRMRTKGGVPVNDYVLQLLCEYIIKSVSKIRRDDEEDSTFERDYYSNENYSMLSFDRNEDGIVEDNRFVRRRARQQAIENLAMKGGELLRNGLEDSVSSRALRLGKRKLLPLFSSQQRKRYFSGLDSTEFQSASESIFERHGWNNIDSGWRFM